MFKSKVLTKEYMQEYKTKIDNKNPRLEKKIRKRLIRKINKEIKIGIKYDRTNVFLDLPKNVALGYSLASKVYDEDYKRILQEVISEYEGEGIKVNKRPYTPELVCAFDFHLEGVFDNDSQIYDI